MKIEIDFERLLSSPWAIVGAVVAGVLLYVLAAGFTWARLTRKVSAAELDEDLTLYATGAAFWPLVLVWVIVGKWLVGTPLILAARLGRRLGGGKS